MTPSEFKAWFDGFTEALEGVPSEKQWERIKARVAEIDGKPITERIYVDRYWSDYWPRPYVGPNYWGSYLAGSSSGGGVGPTGIWNGAVGCPGSAQGGNLNCGANAPDQYKPAFNAETAMYALGKADAESIQ